MSDHKRKRSNDESTGHGSFGDTHSVNDFGVEARYGLVELCSRHSCCVPPSDKNRQNLAGANIQEVNSASGHSIKDCVDLGRTFFRQIPLGQCAGIHVKGIRQVYSSRMSMMPLLN